jgi:hypothetical protein
VATALASIARVPRARVAALAGAVLVVLALAPGLWTTVLTGRMLVRPTGMWDPGIHEALEAMQDLPAAMIVGGLVGLGAMVSLFLTLGGLALAVGDLQQHRRALGAIGLALAAMLLLVGVQVAATSSGHPEVVLVLGGALLGLGLAIAALARFFGLAKTLEDALRDGPRPDRPD